MTSFRTVGRTYPILPMLPLGVLLLTAVGLYLWYARYGYPPQSWPDSRSFQEWTLLDWRGRLENARTPGYPWLLSWGKVWGGYGWLPPLQYALHVLAVVTFYGGLRALAIWPWTALIAALPLLFSPMIQTYGQALLSDAPGLSLAILALGLMLFALGRGGWGWWLGLGLAMAASWLVRPMYLFIVPLYPLLALLVVYMGRSGLAVKGGWQRVLWVALLPFVLYCAMRWQVVGHFGLVSFGGLNISGVATPLLHGDMLPRLPQEVRPLAQAILDKRREMGLGYPLIPQGGIRYPLWYNEFNLSAHQAAIPAAMAANNNSLFLANGQLTRLCHAILLDSPWAYGQWILRSMVESVLHLLRLDMVTQGLSGLLLLLWLKRLVQQQATGGKRSWSEEEIDQEEQDRWAFAVVALLAVGFFGAGTLEVVLVEPPIERYIMGTGALMPALLAVACLRLWRGNV